MERKFKKGDRVRYIGDKHTYTIGHIGIVGDSLRGKALVTFDGVKAVFNESELELAAPDPTTAFLTELQHLLRKYDALICGSPTENAFILIGENKIKCFDSWIGSENVFDYEV